jgi:uncharacterized membrane protein YkgB
MIPIVHWILLLLPPVYILAGGAPKLYDILLALLILTAMHWSFFKNECVLSYIYKKKEDCNYKIGLNTEVVDLKINGSYKLLDISGILTIISGFYITQKLGYSIPLYVLVIALLRLSYLIPNVQIQEILQFAGVPTSIYFLKDNQYLVPILILLLGTSCILYHKDQYSCIVGTKIKNNELVE